MKLKELTRRGEGCVTAIKHEKERDTTWKRMSQSFLFRRYEPAFKGKRETLGSGKCFQKINRKEKKIRIQKKSVFSVCQ